LDGVFKRRYNWLKFGIPVFLILMGGMFFLGHGADAVVQAGVINNAQEASIRMNPILFGVKYLGLPLLIGTVLLIFKFKKLVKTDLGRITLYWIIGLFTVLIWWYPDRFIEYATQPIAIGAGYILTKSKVGGALLPSLVIYGFGMVLALFASLYFSNSIGFDLTGINPFPSIM
jgi:phosphoglycerol transferase MdoB-like AlkP superfamily enzyme